MLVPPAGFGIAEEGVYRCSKVETLNLSFLETLNLKTVLFIGGQEPSKFFQEFFNRSSIEWSLLRIADLSSASSVTTLDNHRRVGIHPGQSTGSNVVPSSDCSSQPFITNNTGSMRVDNSITTNGTFSLNNEHQSDGTTTTNNDKTENGNNYSFKSSYNTHREPSFALNDSTDLMLIKSTCLRKAFKKLLNSQNYNLLLVDKTALIVGLLRKIQKWNISSILNEYRLYSGKHSSYFAETFLELIDIRIEQDNETLDTDKINMNNSLQSNLIAETQFQERKLSNCVVISEEDLCKPPEVPNRLINMIMEAERNERQQLLRKSNDTFIRKLDRKDSDLGIFGHRYRLAFNKKENGRYEYYKSYNLRSQKRKQIVNSNGNTNILASQTSGSKLFKNMSNDNEDRESYDEDDDDVITLNIPKESLLPSWFIYQRDLWEKDNVPDVHHFYKEHIFV